MPSPFSQKQALVHPRKSNFSAWMTSTLRISLVYTSCRRNTALSFALPWFERVDASWEDIKWIMLFVVVAREGVNYCLVTVDGVVLASLNKDAAAATLICGDLSITLPRFSDKRLLFITRVLFHPVAEVRWLRSLFTSLTVVALWDVSWTTAVSSLKYLRLTYTLVLQLLATRKSSILVSFFSYSDVRLSSCKRAAMFACCCCWWWDISDGIVSLRIVHPLEALRSAIVTASLAMELLKATVPLVRPGGRRLEITDPVVVKAYDEEDVVEADVLL